MSNIIKITISGKDPKILGLNLIELMKNYKFDYFDFHTIVDEDNKTTYSISIPINSKLTVPLIVPSKS